LGLILACGFSLFFLAHNGFVPRSIGNGDAAFHIRYLDSFEFKNPKAYHGFSSFYALCAYIRNLFPVNIADTHMAALAIGFFILIATFNAICEAALERVAGFVAFLGAASLAALVSYGLLFPLYNQFFLQGGYVHTFGCVIYPLIIAAYATANDYRFKLPSLLCGVAALRFTYGLNLADCAVGCFSLAAFEAFRSETRRARVVSSVCALLLLGIAGVSFIRLLPLMGQAGASTKFSLPLVWLVYILSLLLALFVSPREGKDKVNSRATAIVSCAAALIAAALIVQLGFFSLGARLRYYMLKHTIYPLTAVIILHTTLVIQAACNWKAKGLVRGSLRLGGPIAILLLLSFVIGPLIKDTFSARSFTIVTKREWLAIESVLKTSGKKFGGYLASSWPAAHYVNEAFGRPMGLDGLRKAKVDISSESCVFWLTGVRREELRRVVKSVKGSVDGRLKQLDQLYESALAEANSGVHVGSFPELRIRYICGVSGGNAT